MATLLGLLEHCLLGRLAADVHVGDDKLGIDNVHTGEDVHLELRLEGRAAALLCAHHQGVVAGGQRLGEEVVGKESAEGGEKYGEVETGPILNQNSTPHLPVTGDRLEGDILQGRTLLALSRQ